MKRYAIFDKGNSYRQNNDVLNYLTTVSFTVWSLKDKKLLMLLFASHNLPPFIATSPTYYPHNGANYTNSPIKHYIH